MSTMVTVECRLLAGAATVVIDPERTWMLPEERSQLARADQRSGPRGPRPSRETAILCTHLAIISCECENCQLIDNAIPKLDEG